jgi:DNA-binding GntR family transcriptional regulator
MAADRIDDEELLPTQEFLAMMLGVRRLGVTVALQELETKGLIRRRRGKIVIRDREILEKFSNGTYAKDDGL